MTDTTKLAKWFTESERRIYFGTRTPDEIEFAAQLIGEMTPEHRTAFKQVLQDNNTMRMTEKTTNGKQSAS